MMRVAAAVMLLVFAASAQFKTTVPLVVAPTLITDSKGRFVDGLTPRDLILYDDNVPQTIQMDWSVYPHRPCRRSRDRGQFRRSDRQAGRQWNPLH